MTTVVPPPPPSPPPTISTPPTPLPTAVVTNPPPALARFPIGALIKGNVFAEQSRGTFQVNIARGSFVMQTNTPLPKNAVLVLQLVSLGPKAQLQIISINGKPLLPALRQQNVLKPANNPATGGVTTSSLAGGKTVTAQASPFAMLRTGATITATLLKPPAGWGLPAAPVAGGAKSKVGAVGPTAAKGAAKGLVGAKSTISGPGKTASAAIAQPSAKAVGKGTSPAAPPSRSVPSSAITGKVGAFPAGSQIKVKVLSLNLAARPAQPAKGVAVPSSPLRVPGPVSLAPGNAITGTVTGKTSSGQPILTTNVGALTLATRTPAPVGSAITLEITGELTPPKHNPAAARTTGEVMLQSRTWPALEEAMKALEEISPAVAQQVTNAVIAQPNARLATNMIFFMSALVGGNISSWIGDGAARTLQRFRPELAEKLKGDFKSLEKMAKESAKGDWRVSLIPIYAGEGIEQIRVMTRNLGDDEKEENEEAEGTRFVVDVDLSRLGRLQLDGLVQDKGKRLDLIVRSSSALPTGMQNDIRGIFLQAGELTSISGGLTFQAGPADFVELSPKETDRLGLIV